MQGTNPIRFIQLPPMVDGSYFDRMTVGEMKQQFDAQITDVHREMEEKGA